MNANVNAFGITFPTPPTIVGNWSSLQTQFQTGGVANTPTAITFDTIEYENSGRYITIRNNRQITALRKGIYLLGFSLQIDQTTGGTSICDFWLRKNGTNVPRTASRITIQGQSQETFPFFGTMLDMEINDYIELVFASSTPSLSITYFPAQTTPPNAYPRPEIPSIIAYAYRVQP